MFRLWLERAECEFLSGNVDKAEQLIMELLRRGTSKVDKAAAYHLKVHLQIVKGEYPQAVDSALACLRLFGIDIPAQPTWEQAEAEYETLWQSLNGRPIESLIDLPLMTDPELQATMHALEALLVPAYYTDLHLFCLHLCLGGEDQLAPRDEWRVRDRLWLARNYPWPGLSPLQRRLSSRQACMRPG